VKTVPWSGTVAAPLPLRLAALVVVLAAGGLVPAALHAAPAAAEPSGSERNLSIPLQCRLGNGTWQPCQMDVMAVGSHWTLQVGDQRLEFRHDGRGGVTMQQGSGGWRTVSSRWEQPLDLCWDGVCARGAIPLD
jgi:hypothetical protein